MMDLSDFKDEGYVPNIPTVGDIARSEVYYFDENGKACDKEHAIRFVATNYDKDGNVINENWGFCVAKPDEEKGMKL